MLGSTQVEWRWMNKSEEAGGYWRSLWMDGGRGLEQGVGVGPVLETVMLDQCR